ncbi:DUF4019 domain-containing protein [Erythrobacter litoralis]|uniref:helix-turn-helix domain-containing protein n=1 Tax=Erythrobacter litoralis TaxID=39960 RepID=UPI002434C814|nr:DUF4019 domain-containing protein [Erythrobacter litoralis]MDG6079324.1 DUF4019 domain-containing protein [Erythrobacter litoralis]
MTDGIAALTDKEKESLRLMLLGHDAKSMARELDLSVHAINDRLRSARRKLSVTSSREAARLLLEAEGPPPELLVGKDLGDGPADHGPQSPAQSEARRPEARDRRRIVAWSIGATLMFSAILALALAGGLPGTGVSGEPSSSEYTQSAEAAARDWLQLGDEGNWEAGYEGTAAAFREANTLDVWTEVSQTVRAPLGEALSRSLRSVEAPPTPQGYVIVTYDTRFAEADETKVETLSMQKEGGAWKVAGIYIE